MPRTHTPRTTAGNAALVPVTTATDDNPTGNGFDANKSLA